MHRWMHNAAGGTIHRLNPGLAIEWLRSRNDNRLIRRVHPYYFRRKANRALALGLGDRFFRGPEAKVADTPRFGNATSVVHDRLAVRIGKTDRAQFHWLSRLHITVMAGRDTCAETVKETSCPPHLTLDAAHTLRRRLSRTSITRSILDLRSASSLSSPSDCSTWPIRSDRIFRRLVADRRRSCHSSCWASPF